MKKIGHFMKYEMSIQFKNGMYVLYIVVNLMYMVLLRNVPETYKELATTLVLLTDPTFLGMIFVGGILLLEKNQGVPKGIGVTPLGSVGYIVCKVGSLLIISLVLGTGIGVASLGKQVNLLTLWVGLGLGASVFTLFGIIMGTYVKNSNQFLILVSVGCTALAIPFLNYLGIWDFAPFKLIPTYSVMCLIESAVKGEGLILKACIYLLACLIVMFKLTEKVITHHLFRS